MAKIMMSVPVSVEIVDKKKKKETLKVEVREFTKEEKKERRELEQKYKDLSKSMTKKSVKLESITKRRDYSEELKEFKDALGYQDKIDTLTEEIQNIVEEVEALGGDDFIEKIAKDNFELLVSGNDKEKLSKIAEIKTYAYVTKLLYTARDEAEGK